MKADHAKVKRSINIAKGQLEGIGKMIDDDRYCLDIYDQIKASAALLNNAAAYILKEHFRSCVKEAILSVDDSKIDEAFAAMNRHQ